MFSLSTRTRLSVRSTFLFKYFIELCAWPNWPQYIVYVGMKAYRLNIMEFEYQFTTEEDCRIYLLELRWPNGFQYPRCNEQRFCHTTQNLYYCKNCGYKTSVMINAIFQDTSTSLMMWFRTMWYVTSQKQGANILLVAECVEIG